MKKQPARTEKNCPVKAYARRATDVQELLPLIGEGLIDCTRAGWQDVSDAARVRELLVQAAFALGKLTEAQARERFDVAL